MLSKRRWVARRSPLDIEREHLVEAIGSLLAALPIVAWSGQHGSLVYLALGCAALAIVWLTRRCRASELWIVGDSLTVQNVWRVHHVEVSHGSSLHIVWGRYGRIIELRSPKSSVVLEAVGPELVDELGRQLGSELLNGDCLQIVDETQLAATLSSPWRGLADWWTRQVRIY